MRIEAPLPEPLTQELMGFWREIFGAPPDVAREAYLGAEAEHNRHTVYLTRRSGKLAGTCHLTTSSRVPRLGGLGEVATDREQRGRGIATDLCRRALDEFRSRGGKALFLGTGNGAAARIYRRLGWRKLAGADLMANVAGGESPEEFLADYFRRPGPAAVAVATPQDRIPMIPLLVAPHDWQVLDANAAMYSTRYCVQRSCMGLYRRYDAITTDGRGVWFSARTADGRVVGLSSARLDEDGGCRVDGFSHARHREVQPGLVRRAAAWAERRGASPVWASVSIEDEDKQAVLDSSGFRPTGRGPRFDLDGWAVESVRMEM